MNKSDLINEVSTKTGLSKVKSSEAVDAVINSIQSALANGTKVTLVGFGTWETSLREGRICRNPKTGEEVSVPSKRVARFRPGSILTKEVNG